MVWVLIEHTQVGRDGEDKLPEGCSRNNSVDCCGINEPSSGPQQKIFTQKYLKRRGLMSLGTGRHRTQLPTSHYPLPESLFSLDLHSLQWSNSVGSLKNTSTCK